MDALRVLVVDDELGMRVGAMRVLERACFTDREILEDEVRYNVTPAQSGEEALEKIAASCPDIVLLDNRLPGLSGMEVLSKVSAASPDVLTVMITAYPTLDTAVAATRAGAFDFLAKPFTPEELRTVIYKATRQIVLRRQARLHADEKRRIRFEFISVLAHELQSPLAAVEGYLLDMQDRAFGTELASYTPLVSGGLLRIRGMRKLVTDLLDLTRLESGTRKREIERLDVVEVAKNVLDTLRGEADDRRVTLSLAAETPVWMNADRTEIELVIANILTNAIKYNHDGGRADLSITTHGDRIHIKVTDTGIGMTAADAGRVFHEFVRIKNEKTRLIPGSGLGLSTVRKVALLYNGDTKMTSAPGVGTTVEVVFVSTPSIPPP